jgi:hypothetical protein
VVGEAVEVAEEGLVVVVVVAEAVVVVEAEVEEEGEEANKQQQQPPIYPETDSKEYHPPSFEEILRCSTRSNKNGNYIEPPISITTT